MKKSVSWMWMTALMAFSLYACRENCVYNHYAHVEKEEWMKNDTLRFTIPVDTLTDRYNLSLGVRTNFSYPYENMALAVLVRPKGQLKGKRFAIKWMRKCDSNPLVGHGLTYTQELVTVGDIYINHTDTLYIEVCHDMQRYQLSGVSDVGVLLSKTK